MLHAYEIKFMINDVKYNFSAPLNENFSEFLNKKKLIFLNKDLNFLIWDGMRS